MIKNSEKSLKAYLKKSSTGGRMYLYFQKGKLAGSSFMEKVTRLLSAWLDGTAMKDIAFTVVIVLLSLLLRKPF